ncbi:M29 family metallopeptidase [Natronincola ferrireducens]|uniref:Leucyl aminopeptidase (Aminopeptidase T) n=1 Tax=Natronincola ferrireducens TaxID=393762 RepID=A0A1G9FT93_9FIRM|nr:leucyl aminopeptidase [Natronincola ferrireducens]SDK91631.1 Leucyl aminopeptidase (aminopeptidase T) [Natronincola ferrireducens]
MKYYEIELVQAAKTLVEDMFKAKKGETFIITADTETDERVVNATAQAVFTAGAKPMIIWVAAPSGVGKAADPDLPVDALSGALKHTDAWIEFNNKWLLYSTPFERAVEENKKLRYMNLVGMNPDMMIRLIGKIDTELLKTFMIKVKDMTKAAKKVKITTPAGTDLEFENNPSHPFSCDYGKADEPGIHYLSGQIGWCPEFDTINGKLVFDGSLEPPLRMLKESVVLHIEKGRVVDIEGGKEALDFKNWLEAFNDPNMLRLAHICYGFNPGAKLTGDIVEDERIWGCTEWGLGYQSQEDAPPDGIPAVSHCDGICLNTSIWLDGVQLLDKGIVVHEEVKDLADKLIK